MNAERIINKEDYIRGIATIDGKRRLAFIVISDITNRTNRIVYLLFKKYDQKLCRVNHK